MNIHIISSVLQLDKIRDGTQYAANHHDEHIARNEIRVHHQRDAAQQWNHAVLFFAVQEIAEADGAEQ